MDNYYDILGCKSDSSYDDIKRAYHTLVLKCHPDKSDASDNGAVSFQEIDEAWKTLRDPESRKVYDESLRQKSLEQQNLLFGTFTLKDLNYDPELEIYSYACKCGGTYSFSREGFEEFNSVLVGCEQCSLMISVDTDYN